MIIMAAVDDRMGMLFHNRRQSQDKVLREHILTLTEGKELWMNEYSAKQFAGAEERLTVSEEFLAEAGPGAFCFVENVSLAEVLPRVERVVLFRWNRAYPGDFFFDLPLTDGSWKITQTEDFVGSSHECITMEVFNHG